MDWRTRRSWYRKPICRRCTTISPPCGCAAIPARNLAPRTVKASRRTTFCSRAILRLFRHQNLDAVLSRYNRPRRHLQKQSVFHYADHVVQLLVQRRRRFDRTKAAIDDEIAAIGNERFFIRTRAQRRMRAQILQLPLCRLTAEGHHFHRDGETSP